EILREIADPPLVLYARGSVATLDLPAIAIVGTRHPSFYGLQMAEGLAGDLAERGIAVASGLARGIDGAAHRGCLASGGRTLAVRGGGGERRGAGAAAGPAREKGRAVHGRRGHAGRARGGGGGCGPREGGGAGRAGRDGVGGGAAGLREAPHRRGAPAP